ncbi:Protein kinase family protein [Rhynchospora pubera]|uniref:Protein kinase family protein n=1 Tax=Rhynchospora pubera TaxID=906938 RepID=A0AAV8GDX6_9POAL|nr:Protein kinase family protein [Rhynchospora pubera]
MAGTIVTTIVSAVVATVVVIIIVKIARCCNLSKIEKITNLIRNSRNSPMNSTTVYQEATIEMDSMEQFLDKILSERPVRYTSEQVMQITDNFSTELGKGGYGVVYKGMFPNGLQVAVKVLKVSINKTCQEQFMAEIGTVGRTYHKNLVKLYGFCFDESTKALLYEYMENGSLDKYLFSSQNQLQLGQLHDIAVGTAKGIRYLHEECQQKIVHYDIKPANVLLKADFTPKVSDFGLAKYCERSTDSNSGAWIFTGGRGTPGYAAPELWNLVIPVTYKCDVYSFGMLLFEILGRRRNFEADQTAESQEWFPRWVWQKFDQGEIATILDTCGFGDDEMRKKAEIMCKVALWCVQYKPEARPTMNGVVRMLEGDMEKVRKAWILSVIISGLTRTI